MDVDDANAVHLSMSRDNLVKILQCFQNDRVKRKDRILIMKRLLDSTETEIDAEEYAPKRKKSKTSKESNEGVGLGWRRGRGDGFGLG